MLKSFGSTLVDSLTNPEAYARFIKQSLIFSLIYFLLFNGIAATLTTLLFEFQAKPQFIADSKQVIELTQASLPDAAQLTLADNKLSLMGSDGPVLIPLPDNLTHNLPSKKHLVAFGQINNSSVVSLGESQIQISLSDDTNQTIAYQELDLPPGTVSKSDIIEFLQAGQTAISNYLTFVVWLFQLFLVTPTHLLTAFVYALFVYLPLWAFKSRLSFKQCFQLSLHLTTFAITATLIKQAVAPSVDFPVDSIAFVAGMLLVINTIKARKNKGETL